jgi:uncharacterized protein (DUF58 family)
MAGPFSFLQRFRATDSVRARAPRRVLAETEETSDDGPLFGPRFLDQLKTLALATTRRRRGGNRGERLSLGRGTGLEFMDHRPYVPGDDLRRIDVAIYQRHRRLFVRDYEEHEDLNVYVVLDCSASMACPSPAKFRAAQRLAAALGYLALSGLDRLTVLGVSGSAFRESPKWRGKERGLLLLRFLEGFRAEGATSLGAAMLRFVRQGQRPGLVVFLTDGYDPSGVEGALEVLSGARHEVVLVQLVDDRAVEDLPHGEVELVDVESNQRHLFVIDPGFKTDVLAREVSRRQALSAFALRKGMRSEILDARVPLQRAVRLVLGRGKGRR